MRAWKNYLLQRKYRNILEEFRRKSYQKTIKKYIENRMEIFNDIKEIQLDMTSNDKSVVYLKSRVKLIETFEAQGKRKFIKGIFLDVYCVVFCAVNLKLLYVLFMCLTLQIYFNLLIVVYIIIISFSFISLFLTASVRAKNVKLEMASLKFEDFERG